MKMDLKLKVFTLNCWGIVGISRHRKERMTAIASYLAASDFDFVFLQELWSEADFQMICKRTALVLPYSHYFYSGVLGSGVCVLSRSCIMDTFQYQYSLNGYAHKILHGDWFGGKAVGLCRVNHSGLTINLYVTHLHAEYNCINDQYLPHRVVQAFELSQFVRTTSGTADLSIVAGDFNAEPCDLPYQLIVHNGECVDTFITQSSNSVGIKSISTCGHPENFYTSKKELKECPSGKRIDYIMYKCGKDVYVKCLKCETPVRKIPGSSIPYSDHEAVLAELHVFKTVNALAYEADPNARFQAIKNSNDILVNNIKSLKNKRLFYFMLCFLILAVLFIITPLHLSDRFEIMLRILQIICTLCLTFCLWMAVIMNKIEHNAFLSVCRSMNIIMNSLLSDCSIEICTKPMSDNSHSELVL